MKGVILAAGKGARLCGLNGNTPKCLLRIGGPTLIERHIDTLRAAGIDDVVLVVGCQADQVRRICGPQVTFVENTRFAQTNSLYSLWLARTLLRDGFVVMNCDVLFHPQLLTDLLTTRYEDALLIGYDQGPLGEEEMKVRTRCGRVVEIAKNLDPLEADGENVGIVKFGPAGAAVLIDLLDQRVAAGGLRDWAPRAFAEFARRRPLHVVGTRGYPWTEIDFPEDYERAIAEILPAIEADSAVQIDPGTTVRVRSMRLRTDASGSALLPAAGE
jgi:choline kinase